MSTTDELWEGATLCQGSGTQRQDSQALEGGSNQPRAVSTGSAEGERLSGLGREAGSSGEVMATCTWR